MQRTSAHLYIEFATDFLLYFDFFQFASNFCSRDQYTALHCAACDGHTAVCEQLIANKADVNAKEF